ncbi:MAG: type IX secretion system sortase PorU [Candidatus Latescibacterota bacterium]|jgi:hypothetical protein
MNRRFYVALLAILLAGSELWADLRVIDTGSNYIRLEYRAVETARGNSGGTFLVGVPAQGDVHLELIEAEGTDGRPLAAGRALATIEGIGMARRQRVAELSFLSHRGADGQDLSYSRAVVELRFDAATGRAAVEPSAEGYYSQILSNYEQAKNWRLPRGPRKAAKTVQSEGTWLRVNIREEGMHRITGQELEQAGIDLHEVDPQTLRLFYGGGRALSLRSAQQPQPLDEMGLVVEDGGDGRFDAEDFVLFYGEPLERWEYDDRTGRYEWLQNLYTHENVYWLGFGGGVSGLRATVRSGALDASAPERPTSHRVRIHSEDEQFVLNQTFGIKSGYSWYSEDFSSNALRARNFRFVVRDPVDDPVVIRFGFIGINGNRASFSVRWNDIEIGQVAFDGNTYVTRELQAEDGPVEGLNELGIFHSGDPTRFDWYELEYSRGFSAERGLLNFFSPVIDQIAEYELSGFEEEEPRVFEVSDRLVEIHHFEYDSTSGQLAFQDDSGSASGQYVIGGPATWKRPLKMTLDTPSSLVATTSGADYLVIYHADFAAAAERLARWRAQDDRFGAKTDARAIDIQDIYDEFSGGLLDPAALRNFLAYAESNWQPAPFYIALMGDGSYDYKNNSRTSRGNWIPPYQDGDSTYDEWYVRIVGNDELPDMAIGRLPVQTAAAAEQLVDKIITYDREPEIGPWQSRVLLVADDLSNPDRPQDVEAYFISDSEIMSNRYMPENLDLDKLYLAQFPLEGRAKPRARDEFIRRFNEGALILTYLGHGNPDVLAHEQLFRVSRDLGEIDNGRRLPFFYTAASQVGVFDDPVKTSMPEELLNLPDGGVIGMISATRVGFHVSNVVLAAAFHGQMYRSGRLHVPVGLALMEAKQIARGSTSPGDRVALRNMQRYSIFGDPLQRLAAPRYSVDVEVDGPLSALGLVEVRGRVLDEAGNIADNYNGFAWLQAFDSAEMSLLDGLRYRQVGTHLFRGRYAVEKGRFSAVFRVPKDITYGGEDGRMSAYAWSEDLPAAFGSLEGIVLSGTAPNVELDLDGPQIRLGFKGQNGFRSGDKVSGQPVLYASISDPSGINITGETGHEIELVVDEQVFKVTDFFSVLEGDYREGVVEFPIEGVEPGEHTVRLKAWDTFNNSARNEATFVLAEGDNSAIKTPLFYPNPLRGENGHFTYDLSARAMSTRIQVFSLSGRLVDEVEGSVEEGYNQIFWQKPANLANGTYLYKIEIHQEDGGVAERMAALQITQ